MAKDLQTDLIAKTGGWLAHSNELEKLGKKGVSALNIFEIRYLRNAFCAVGIINPEAKEAQKIAESLIAATS